VLADTVARLESVDIDSLMSADARAVLHDLAQVRGWAEVMLAGVAHRLEQLQESGQGGDAKREVTRSMRSSSRDAERAMARGRRIAKQPELGASLSQGAISAEHIDVIASVTANLNEEQRAEFDRRSGHLDAIARAESPERFRRHVQNVVDQIVTDCTERVARQRQMTRFKSWWNLSTGMFHTSGVWDTETGTMLERAIKAASTGLKNDPDLAKLEHEQRDAAAVAELILGSSRSERPGAVEAIVIVDAETVEHGVHDFTVCEYTNGVSLPVESARRLLCNASHITWVGVDRAGAPLNLGLTERHANRTQRRLLRAMYPTCAIEACDVRFERCEVHHVVGFTGRHGPTDIANLVPICTRHHHLVHEGRWTLSIDPDRCLTLRRPDGTIDQISLFKPPYPPARSRGRAGHPPNQRRTFAASSRQ
jgi:hypothetical protein